jgi:Cu(I)/Ag(I) efflux system periplasmic protein CusF
MSMLRRLVLAAGLAGSLAACQRSETEPAAAEAPQPKTARVAATVVGVDPPNGTITLQHGPIPEWGWPATRMAFTAPAEAIAGAKVGQRVTAELKHAGGATEIAAISTP